MDANHNETVNKTVNHKTSRHSGKRAEEGLVYFAGIRNKRISWSDSVTPFTFNLTPIIIQPDRVMNDVLSLGTNGEYFCSTFLPEPVTGGKFYFTSGKDSGQFLPSFARWQEVSDQVQPFSARVETFTVTPQLFCVPVRNFSVQVQLFCVQRQMFIATSGFFCVPGQLFTAKVQKSCARVQLFIVTPQTFQVTYSRFRYIEATRPPLWNMVNFPWIHYLLISNMKSYANKNRKQDPHV